jgi:hypothetical protein
MAEAIRLAHNWDRIMNKEGGKSQANRGLRQASAESHSVLMKEPVNAVMA